jgi:hypothetical protein
MQCVWSAIVTVVCAGRLVLASEFAQAQDRAELRPPDYFASIADAWIDSRAECP